MMTGTTVTTLIKGIREDIKNYPNLSTTLLDLYDEKDRITIDNEVEFATDLFANNESERARFIEYLNALEKSDPVGITAKITESYVILYYQTPFAKTFSRKKFMEPIDYMD